MRLLFFFWGSGDGGDATACIELARALKAHGASIKVAAYAFAKPVAFRERAIEAGLSEPILVKNPAKVFESGLNREDFDLIHVHHGTAIPKRTDIVPLRKMAGGLPIVLTAHGPTPLSEITYGGWRSNLSRRFAARWFEAVIVPSHAKAAEWQDLTPLSRNVVAIPNVVRFLTRKDKTAARNSFSLATGAEIVLFCSRLDPDKRPMAFVKSVEEAAKSRPNLLGVMAGTGELERECAAYIEERNLPMRMLGYVNDVQSLYSSADLFVQCSSHESFGITLFQAAAMGLSCVATDIPVFREIYGDFESIGWVGFGDRDLALAINDQLEHPPITCAQLELKERYSEAAVVKKHLKLYGRVLGK
jgi:glycosyltransferase involved in cell wall biosynthesis